MDGGFGRALEGFEIKGNLSVIADEYDSISSGNGSIEGSGSLFIDKIFNYTSNTGVNIENSVFKAGLASISNLFLTNATIDNKAFFSNGIDNSGKLITNVTSPSNDLDAANKYYVDLVASNFSTSGSTNGSGITGSFTSGQIIIANSTSGLSGFASLTFNSTTGTMILGTSGSIIINNTINATSITSSNSLFTYGGITAQGKVWSNGLDVNSNTITNVTSPTVGLDAANKYYVDSIISLASGDIQPERVFILANSVSVPTNITTFVFDNTVVSSFEAIVYLSIPTLSIYEQYTMYGVLSGSTWILNYKSIGSGITNINFSITNISNTGQVQYTNANSSGIATIRFRATTTSQTSTISNLTFGNVIFKEVPQGGTGQTFFTEGTVLIGNGVNSINSYNNFKYINETLFLSNTLNATSLTSGPVLLSGGFSVAKNSFLNGIDNNGKLITNVTSPTNDLDVANKYYVDSLSSNGSSNVNGSFTSGQIIIANSTSGLSGFANLTFNSTTGTMILGTSGSIIINNTINATSITSSNSLFTYGGITAQGKVWSNGLDVNSNTITNVTSPTVGLDAANKYYVDSIISLASGDIQPERVFILANSVSVPTNITTFVFDNTVVSSFEAIVYLSIPTLSIYEQYTMYGVLSGSTWILNYKSIGSGITNINFSITNISNTGQVQYTNANSSGIATIRFRATTTSQTSTISNLTFGNVIFKEVPQGGTGQTFFTEGTVLIGNGVNSINSYNNFKYINETLFLNNTVDATSSTDGGTFTDKGGASIAKSLYVGNTINSNTILSSNVIFTSTTSSNVNIVNTLNANTISVGNIITDSGKTPISASAFKIYTSSYSRVLSWVYDPVKDYKISSVSFISNLSNSGNTDYYQSRLVNVSSNFILGVSNTLNNLDTPNTYNFTLSTSGVTAITSPSILEFQTYITTNSIYAYAYVLSATLF